jgi:purine-binding chemotaxis protein CheW
MTTDAFDTQTEVMGTPQKFERTFQIVRAGSRLCGIATQEILTIADWQEPTPLPNAPPVVLGVVSVQGCMLTVLSLAELISNANSANITSAPETSRHIVALRGDEQLALAVIEVGEVIELAADQLNEVQSPSQLIGATVTRNGAEITILNLKELFPTAIQGRERRRRRF